MGSVGRGGVPGDLESCQHESTEMVVMQKKPGPTVVAKPYVRPMDALHSSYDESLAWITHPG